MSATAERLAALKVRLEKAREENLEAVEDEGRRRNGLKKLPSERHTSDSETEGHSSRHGLEKNHVRRPRRSEPQNVAIDVGSADEADDEDDDERLRSMKRRARAASRHLEAVEVSTNRAKESNQVIYGGSSSGQNDDVDRMVGELERLEKRRAKYRRRRTFDEDRTNITFINEGNRLFNRTLEKHFDKFESVQKIKDSLERGTA